MPEFHGGKLMERNDTTRTKMMSDPQEMYRYLAMPGIEVAAFEFASDNVVWASWRYIVVEEVPNLRHTNKVFGCYVTAGARIHLYGYLDSLQKRVLNCDTDSVIIHTADCRAPAGSNRRPSGNYDVRGETGLSYRRVRERRA